MKLIIFNNYPIIPPNFGGAIRIYKIANYIAINGIETHLIAPKGKEESSYSPSFIYHTYPTLHRYSHVIGDIINMHIFFNQIIISLKNITSRKDLILQAEHIYSIYPAYFLKILFRIPLVVTEHNLEGNLAKKISKSKIYANYLELLERFFLKRVDYIVCVSDNDKKILMNEFKIPDQKISVIPNGADINNYQLDKKSNIKLCYGDSSVVIFMGPTEYIPNKEAIKIIEYFLNPRIKEEIPNVLFLIVGKGHEFCIDKNIIYTGYVKDVTPYLEASDVAIAPLLSGGGTRIKLLEYFAAGKAVVSTTKGAEGIEVEHNENILIADNWIDFADRIIELLKNTQLRNYIGNNARELVEKKYQWEKLANDYIELYKKILK